MSKAEDRAAKKALETFPILFGERMEYDKTNLQQERRNAYEKGYHQAEKDLELGWEDIEKIVDLYDDVYCDFSIDGKGGKINAEEHYQEVLKRFKERKRNHD